MCGANVAGVKENYNKCEFYWFYRQTTLRVKDLSSRVEHLLLQTSKH